MVKKPTINIHDIPPLLKLRISLSSINGAAYNVIVASEQRICRLPFYNILLLLHVRCWRMRGTAAVFRHLLSAVSANTMAGLFLYIFSAAIE